MSRPSHPPLRLAASAIGFCLGLSAMLALVGLSTRAASLEPGYAKLDRLASVEERVAILAAAAIEGEALHIGFMGDSTVDPPSRIDSLPFRLQQRLSRWRWEGSAAVVHSLAAPALGSVTYHFLARDIIAAQPDLIVWQVAFTHTNGYWLTENTHHEFAGRLPLLDIGRTLLLPIHELGLSADDLLAYKLLMTPGLRTAWQWLGKEQSRVQKGRDAFEEWLTGGARHRPERKFRRTRGLRLNAGHISEVDGRLRYLGSRAVMHLGEGLRGLEPDHVLVRVLGETLGLFREAGIPVVMYLNPINIEHLRGLEVVDDDLLAMSIETYRSVAVESGAIFVDLHDAVPDASFIDARGHFHRTEAFDAAGRMIDKIQPPVADELDRIAGQRTRVRPGANGRSGR